jgi:membrane protease YdiL (CAAX protease family)
MDVDALAVPQQSDASRSASVNTAIPASKSGNCAKPKWKFLLFYYFIACAFAWIVWLLVILGPDGLKVFKTAFSLPVFISIGTFGPFVAAFIALRVETGYWRGVRLLPRGRRWIWLFSVPSLCSSVSFFFSRPSSLRADQARGTGTWSQ